MASLPPRPERRRPRRGSLERPINARSYRGTWLLVAIPLLIAAFSVKRAPALPLPSLPPAFDTVAALDLADELAGSIPDRRPGTDGGNRAARWVAANLQLQGFATQTDRFEGRIPGLGRVALRNVVAIAPGRSPQAIVVMAHRDDTGIGPGANDNASGTGALLELARSYANLGAGGGSQARGAGPAHNIIFLSTDAGSFGALGALRFATHSPYRHRVLAVVNLDSIAGPGSPGIQLAGDAPRSPPSSLIETAAARLREQAAGGPRRPSVIGQLIDLAFPFNLYEQAPFVGRGIPAVTLTTTGARPPSSLSDTPDRLRVRRLGQMGRATQLLVGSLDQGLELARGTAGYVFLGARFMPGWAIELVLIAALVPFLVAVVDLFAYCRRRRIKLIGAVRSYVRRLGFWAWVGASFAFLTLLGAWPQGASQPPNPGTRAAGHWPVVGLIGLLLLAAVGWLVSRERLIPRRPVRVEEELAGYTGAMVVLAILALLTAASNPFALIFILPSLHAWLWLPQIRDRPVWVRLAVLGTGFAGPLLLLASMGIRFGLGLDAPWYVTELVALGYVPLPAIAIFLAWLGVAGQLTALEAQRYAPYPTAGERPSRGPVRAGLRRILVGSRNRGTRDELAERRTARARH
ncbi:MAG TPA: M28 family peptidase [Gaiellaceae bacterium]